MKRRTKPNRREINIHHYTGDNVKCKLPDPNDPARFEERYQKAPSDAANNGIVNVPHGMISKDSPLRRGYDSNGVG